MKFYIHGKGNQRGLYDSMSIQIKGTKRLPFFVRSGSRRRYNLVRRVPIGRLSLTHPSTHALVSEVFVELSGSGEHCLRRHLRLKPNLILLDVLTYSFIFDHFLSSSTTFVHLWPFSFIFEHFRSSSTNSVSHRPASLMFDQLRWSSANSVDLWSASFIDGVFLVFGAIVLFPTR